MTDDSLPVASRELLTACPFLSARLDPDDLDLPTIVFGATASLLRARALAPEEEDQVFDYFNTLAERGSPNDLEVLGTGAIEKFNDDAASQALARSKLKGRALSMLEEFRIGWGQPDYGLMG